MQAFYSGIQWMRREYIFVFAGNEYAHRAFDDYCRGKEGFGPLFLWRMVRIAVACPKNGRGHHAYCNGGLSHHLVKFLGCI